MGKTWLKVLTPATPADPPAARPPMIFPIPRREGHTQNDLSISLSGHSDFGPNSCPLCVTSVSAWSQLRPFFLLFVPAPRRRAWPHAKPAPTGKVPMITLHQKLKPHKHAKRPYRCPQVPSCHHQPEEGRYTRFCAPTCFSLAPGCHLLPDALHGGQSSQLRLESVMYSWHKKGPNCGFSRTTPSCRDPRSELCSLPGGIRTFLIGLGYIWQGLSQEVHSIWHTVSTLPVG